MSTVPTARAREEILKLGSDRQALPLLVLEQFDSFFAANDYAGYYKWSNAGGAHYFIYDGKGKLNKQYRIVIEMYWDEMNFTIERSLNKWEKFTDFLRVVGTSIFCLFWIFLLVASFTGGSGGSLDIPSGGYESKRKKKKSAQGLKPNKKQASPRSFKLSSSARDIAPDTELTNAITPATYEAAIKQHRAFFEQYLLQSIRGEEWMVWREGYVS